MRGFLQPAIKPSATDAQKDFAKLPRGKRSKAAKLAQTTLVKVDQWARGELPAGELSGAIERALASLKTSKKKA
jgi:hypothetical protein